MARKPVKQKVQFDVEGAFKRMEDQIKTLSDRNERLQTLTYSLMGQRTAQPEPDAGEGQAVKIDWSGLPDPTTDPEKYAQAVQSRIDAAVNGAVTKATQRTQAAVQKHTDIQTRVNELWAKFGEKYPELAGQNEVIDIQARKVISELGAQGLPIETIMFSDPDGFLEKVGTRTKEFLTKLGWKPQDASTEADDDGEDQDGPPVAKTLGKPSKRVLEAQDDDGQDDEPDADDDDRSASLFGGYTPQATEPSKPSKGGDQGGFVSDMKNMQRKMGIV